MIEIRFTQLDEIQTAVNDVRDLATRNDGRITYIERRISQLMAGIEELNTAVDGVATALAATQDEVQEAIDLITAHNAEVDVDLQPVIDRLTAIKDGLSGTETSLRSALTPPEPPPSG